MRKGYPRPTPTLCCIVTSSSCRSGGSAHPCDATQGGSDAAGWGDGVPEHAEALDLELDHVAWPEPAAVAVLEDAAGADGARAEDVARGQLGVARGVRHDRLPRVVHVAEVAPRALLPVH